MERYQDTFTGEKRPITETNRRHLSPSEKKIYNLIRNRWRGITRKELEKMTALDDVVDIDRALRKIREKGWIKSTPQRRGPQKWEAI